MAQKTMYLAKAGSPTTTTTSAIAVDTTTISVAELGVLPDSSGICIIYTSQSKWERCIYTAKSNSAGSGTITVTRSGEGHASSDASNGPLEFESGAKVMRNFTEYDHYLFKYNIEDLATNKITAAGVTYENLSANGDIGTAATQVSQGNHTHSTYQLLDATLTALAGVTTAADEIIYATAADTFTTCTLTSLARSLIAAADALAMLTVLGITATVDELNYCDGVTSAIQTQLNGKQPIDATLTALAGVTTAADNIIYATAADTFTTCTLTSLSRSLIAAADALAMLTVLGITATVTELNYTDGVTSAIQTQLDGKVIAPGTTTENKVPQWDSTTKTLKDGLVVGTAANNLLQLDSSAKIPAVDGSQLTGLVAALPIWMPITTFTATPTSTSTITMGADITGTVKPGMAVKYVISSVTYYGIVTAITSGLMTIAGAPLSGTITSLYYGTNPAQVVQVDFFVSGKFSDAANTALLSSDAKTAFNWNLPEARLVQIKHKVSVDDSGAAQPRVNITAGGSAVSTSNTNAGVAVAETWSSTVVDINTTNYVVSYGEAIEISTDANGTNDDATDLTVSGVFVLI